MVNSSQTPKEVLLSNEFGRSEEIEQLAQVLQSIQSSTIVNIVPINLENYETVLQEIRRKDCTTKGEIPRLVVVNLCDGTEEDGYPGITIVKTLEELGLAFTGAGSEFYQNTTSKPILKEMLIKENVPTSRFVSIRPDFIEQDVQEATKISPWPLIIKPAVSYASINISEKSIVYNVEDAVSQIKSIINDNNGGVFMETFLAGHEFTALVTGDKIQGTKVYPVAERVFNPKLAGKHKILAFDRYWDGFDLDGSKPDNAELLVHYEKANESWQDILQDIARRAYIACKGTGYGRVDIRSKALNEVDAYVLEVNANCGISFGKESSSLGEILLMSNVSSETFCKELITYALMRAK